MRKIRINNLNDYADFRKKETILDWFFNNRVKYIKLLTDPGFAVNPTIIYFLEQYAGTDAAIVMTSEEKEIIVALYNRLCGGRSIDSLEEFRNTMDQKSGVTRIAHLFKPILRDMEITLLDLYKFDQVYLKRKIAEGTFVLSRELNQLIRLADQESQVHSAHWFVLQLRDIKIKNQEIDCWKNFILKVEQENRTILIHDPFQMIDKHMQVSLARLYFEAYRLFTMLLDTKRVLVSKKVIAFFRHAMPPHHIMPALKEEEIKKRWFSFSERNHYVNCAEVLLKKTRRGKLDWMKTRNFRTETKREFRFVTKNDGHSYTFNVYANKSDTNNNWYCTFELLEDSLRDTEFPALYQKLFKLVMECATEPGKKRYEDKKAQKKSCKKRVVLQSALLVRTHIFKCRYDDHDVEDTIGEFSILLPDGSIQIELAEAAYCPVCGCFFIHEYEYERLAAKGLLLCRVLENEIYRSDRYHDYSSMKAESLLMQNGYTVKSQNALTEAQRRSILKNVIDTGVLSKAAVISYLQLFIKQRENLPLCERAVEKWSEDLEYVKQLEIICE